LLVETNKGELFVCGTPIGNLKDITLRALECLDNVDIIVCEDTRHSLKLLNHYQKEKKKLISFHRHSSIQRLEEIRDLLLRGYRLALISDAGMPGVSDPGSQVISMARENGVKVSIVPGPSAVTAALSLSGYPADRFLFWGFLSSSSQKKNQEISRLIRVDETVVILETPHRIKKTLQELKEYVEDREMTVLKELTKKHEEVFRGSPGDLAACFESKEKPRGEYVIVLSPREKQEEDKNNFQESSFNLKEDLKKLLAAGLPPTQAAKSVSLLRGVDRKKVYSLMVDMKK